MLTRLVVIALLLGASTGCSKRTTDPMQSRSASTLKSIPADGATAVRLDAGVSLDFGVAVDRGAVENGFHLVSEADMRGACPDAAMPAHGSMDAVMNDPTMLGHMDAFHATAGSFSWNDQGTLCTFLPDTLMRAQTRYMMHMDRTMLDMMDRMGGMMSGGQMTASGDMVTHFQTITDDGHSGHH